VPAQALVVGAGGFVGAALRCGGQGRAARAARGFPFATFLINVTAAS
jgi:fluoride ion exporter CrcB/FEX